MKSPNKTVCLVTGSRADYGILEPVLQGFKEASVVTPYLIITGEHLSRQDSISLKEIDTDNCIVKYVDMLLGSSSRIGVSKSIGLGIISFSEVLQQIRPHIIVLVGDRFEALSVAVAAYTLGIPIAHMRGGEISGTLDDGYRHTITQLATYHFTSNEEHTERIVRMGKPEDNVFTVGDTAYIPEIIDKTFPHNSNSAMLIYHPVSDLPDYGLEELRDLLFVLEDELSNSLDYIYVSGTNSDAGSKEIDGELRNFANKHDRVEFNQSLGHTNFVLLLSCVNVVVGNSSAGLSIAPSLGIGIINVGSRQKGRMSSPLVIDCSGSIEDITKAFETYRSGAYQAILSMKYNPYRKEKATERIVDILLERIF